MKNASDKAMEDPDEIISECKIWLANRRAQLDQMQKQFDDQYPVVPPSNNRRRLEDLEVRKFQIEIHEWELEEFVKGLDEAESSEPGES